VIKVLEEPNRISCTVHQMITLHILQYSYSIMRGSATVCCCIDCINCTAADGWKNSTEGMALATQWAVSGEYVTVQQ